MVRANSAPRAPCSLSTMSHITRASGIIVKYLASKSNYNKLGLKTELYFIFGFVLQSRIERDKLTCHYNRNLPTQLLKPVKVEMLNLEPDLYLFHEIITDSEIEHVKKLAKPQVSDLNSTQLLPVIIHSSVSSTTLCSSRWALVFALGALTGGARLFKKLN